MFTMLETVVKLKAGLRTHSDLGYTKTWFVFLVVSILATQLWALG